MPKQIASLASHATKLRNPKRISLGDYWVEKVALRLLSMILITVLCACCSDDDALRKFREGAYDSSFKTFARRADNGDSAATNFVGIHYYLGLGVRRDFSSAARWFMRAARAGNADAQRNLGVLYLRGWGVKRDDEMAYGWLFEAIERGNRGAHNYLSALEITPNQTMRARQRVAKQLRQPDEGVHGSDAE